MDISFTRGFPGLSTVVKPEEITYIHTTNFYKPPFQRFVKNDAKKKI